MALGVYTHAHAHAHAHMHTHTRTRTHTLVDESDYKKSGAAGAPGLKNFYAFANTN